VKVVVVAMFERGADTGDEPGEFQYWVERNKLDRVIPFPQGYHDLRMNRDGVLGIVTGSERRRPRPASWRWGWTRASTCEKRIGWCGIAGIDPADGRSGRRRGRNGWWMATWLTKSTRVRFPRTGKQDTCRCANRCL